ncbi:unnamed protein product [Amoebophrya sp. A120]|nr:unnamed protein product [Amoebophrya sp. A120]|eukprot:GSA120T00008555001.1
MESFPPAQHKSHHHEQKKSANAWWGNNRNKINTSYSNRKTSGAGGSTTTGCMKMNYAEQEQTARPSAPFRKISFPALGGEVEDGVGEDEEEQGKIFEQETELQYDNLQAHPHEVEDVDPKLQPQISLSTHFDDCGTSLCDRSPRQTRGKTFSSFDKDTTGGQHHTHSTQSYNSSYHSHPPPPKCAPPPPPLNQKPPLYVQLETIRKLSMSPSVPGSVTSTLGGTASAGGCLKSHHQAGNNWNMNQHAPPPATAAAGGGQGQHQQHQQQYHHNYPYSKSNEITSPPPELAVPDHQRRSQGGGSHAPPYLQPPMRIPTPAELEAKMHQRAVGGGPPIIDPLSGGPCPRPFVPSSRGHHHTRSSFEQQNFHQRGGCATSYPFNSTTPPPLPALNFGQPPGRGGVAPARPARPDYVGQGGLGLQTGDPTLPRGHDHIHPQGMYNGTDPQMRTTGPLLHPRQSRPPSVLELQKLLPETVSPVLFPQEKERKRLQSLCDRELLHQELEKQLVQEGLAVHNPVFSSSNGAGAGVTTSGTKILEKNVTTSDAGAGGGGGAPPPAPPGTMFEKQVATNNLRHPRPTANSSSKIFDVIPVALPLRTTTAGAPSSSTQEAKNVENPQDFSSSLCGKNRTSGDQGSSFGRGPPVGVHTTSSGGAPGLAIDTAAADAEAEKENLRQATSENSINPPARIVQQKDKKHNQLKLRLKEIEKTFNTSPETNPKSIFLLKNPAEVELFTSGHAQFCSTAAAREELHRKNAASKPAKEQVEELPATGQQNEKTGEEEDDDGLALALPADEEGQRQGIADPGAAGARTSTASAEMNPDRIAANSSSSTAAPVDVKENTDKEKIKRPGSGSLLFRCKNQREFELFQAGHASYFENKSKQHFSSSTKNVVDVDHYVKTNLDAAGTTKTFSEPKILSLHSMLDYDDSYSTRRTKSMFIATNQHHQHDHPGPAPRGTASTVQHRDYKEQVRKNNEDGFLRDKSKGDGSRVRGRGTEETTGGRHKAVTQSRQTGSGLYYMKEKDINSQHNVEGEHLLERGTAHQEDHFCARKLYYDQQQHVRDESKSAAPRASSSPLTDTLHSDPDIIWEQDLAADPVFRTDSGSDTSSDDFQLDSDWDEQDVVVGRHAAPGPEYGGRTSGGRGVPGSSRRDVDMRDAPAVVFNNAGAEDVGLRRGSSCGREAHDKGRQVFVNEAASATTSKVRPSASTENHMPVPRYYPWFPYTHTASSTNLPMHQQQAAQRTTSAMLIQQPQHLYPSTQPRIPQNILTKEHFQQEKYDLDTLFFVFYYQKNSHDQLLAAAQLEKLGWRYHKLYNLWFQRESEPRECNSEFEKGDYRYFDHEKAWRQRLKQDFRFDYIYLEEGVLEKNPELEKQVLEEGKSCWLGGSSAGASTSCRREQVEQCGGENYQQRHHVDQHESATRFYQQEQVAGAAAARDQRISCF